MEESRLPRMRDMKLNDPVSVTLPAHIWVGFQSVYMSAEGNGDFFSEAICNASIEQIIDPLYVQERDAATEKRTHEGLRHLGQRRVFCTAKRDFPISQTRGGDDLRAFPEIDRRRQDLVASL